MGFIEINIYGKCKNSFSVIEGHVKIVAELRNPSSFYHITLKYHNAISNSALYLKEDDAIKPALGYGNPHLTLGFSVRGLS